jgi:regulator of replication initiation timing
MYQFLLFWCKCALQGWHVGDSAFGIVEGLCILTAALSFTLKNRVPVLRNHPEWEKQVMKWAGRIFAVAFVISTLFVAPFLQNQAGIAKEKKLASATNELASALGAEKKETARLNHLFQDNDRAFRSLQVENSKLLHENAGLKSDNEGLKRRVADLVQTLSSGWTTEDQQRKEKAYNASSQAKAYREGGDSLSSVAPFEECYVYGAPIALKHPEYRGEVSHQLGNLAEAYQKNNRPSDAIMTTAARSALDHAPNRGFTSPLEPLPPELQPVVILYNRLKETCAP